MEKWVADSIASRNGWLRSVQEISESRYATQANSYTILSILLGDAKTMEEQLMMMDIKQNRD
jgi:hypothetical protein